MRKPRPRGCLLALLFTTAGTLQAANGGSGIFLVEAIHHTETGEAIITLANNHLNPGRCSNSRQLLIVDNANKFRLLATVVMAKSTGQTVNFYLVGCSELNGNDYAKAVTAVWRS